MFYQPHSYKATYFCSNELIGDNNERLVFVTLHHENHVYRDIVKGIEDPATGSMSYYDKVEMVMSLPQEIKTELDDYCMLLAEHMDIQLSYPYSN